MMLKLFIFCALLAVAFARSTGAPISACGSMNPIGHMKSGFTAQDLGFTVSVEPASNELFDVTVSGPANFRGVFIQVRRSGTAMGNFVNPPENYKLIDCFDSSDSALTHSNGGDKGTSVTARWQAPDDCSGTLTVMATVVVSFTTFQTGITTTLDCTTTTTTMEPTTTTTTEAPPPPPPVTTTESPPPPTTTTIAPTTTTTTTTVAPTTTTTTTMAPTTTTTTTEEVETTEEMVEMEGFEEGRSIEINQPSPEPPAITTTTEETTTKGGMGMMCKHDNMTKLPENKYKTKFNMVPYNGWMNTGKPRYVSTSYGRGYVRPTWKKAVEFEAGGKKNFYMRMGGKSLVRGDMVSLHTRYELRGCFCVHLSFRMPVAGNRLTVLSYLKPLKSMKQRQTTWKKMSVQVDSKRTTMIRVVATRGMKRSASVEVDNLYIMKGMCDKPQYQG